MNKQENGSDLILLLKKVLMAVWTSQIKYLCTFKEIC